MADVEATTMRLNQVLNGMIKGSQKDKRLQAELIALHNYMAAIFKLSKTVSNLPPPSKIKTEKESRLHTLQRLRYYYNIASLINSMPLQFRAKDNEVKIAFDHVVLAANALAKATPTKRKQYATVFNKSVAIFTRYAASVITNNIKKIDVQLEKSKINPRQLRKFRDYETKIIKTCAAISGVANKWDTYAASGLVLTPEVSVASSILVAVWAIFAFFSAAAFYAKIFHPGVTVLSCSGEAAFAVATVIMWIPLYCVGTAAIELLLAKLGYQAGIKPIF